MVEGLLGLRDCEVLRPPLHRLTGQRSAQAFSLRFCEKRPGPSALHRTIRGEKPCEVH